MKNPSTSSHPKTQHGRTCFHPSLGLAALLLLGLVPSALTGVLAAGAKAKAPASKSAPAVSAAVPTPARPLTELTLRGPEVVKLDWNTRALQIADINSDGLADIAVANNDQATIALLYQVRTGEELKSLPRTLSANRWEPVIEDSRYRKASVTTGVTVFDLLVKDINGDGRPDLIYTGAPQALTIRYQQADGSWSEKKITEAPAPNQGVGSLKATDLDGDGRDDLILLGQKEIAVFYQTKDGQLGTPDRYPLPDDNCYGLELSDVNGDGLVDLVYLCAASRTAMRVRLQTDGHQFGPELAYEIKPSRCTLQIVQQADGKGSAAAFAFAQDSTGQLEIFSLKQIPADPAALPALRPRVFSPRPGSKTPSAYALGDFTGNKRTDIAVSDPDAAQVFIYLRQPDGGFASTSKYPVFSDARCLTAGDWDGDGRDELIVGSAKEQAVGISRYKDGRFSYPQPLPISGKPLGLAFGDIAGDGRKMLAVLREEKGKRYVELWVRKDDGAECLKSIEITGAKTDPRALQLVDANQDGKLDLAVFIPLDAMRLYVQGDNLEFTEASADAAFRRGLVDKLESSALTLGDINGDGRQELITSSAGFARALRLEETNGQANLVVIDQYNARDPGTDVATTLVIPRASKGSRPDIVLYDRKAEQFQILRADEHGLYAVADSVSAGKIEVVDSTVRRRSDGSLEAFIFGRDRFWWIPIGQSEYTAATVATHTTDLPDVSYADVIVGDINNDGRPEIVCVDPVQNLLEILRPGPDEQWESMMHFKIFETDQHFQGRRGVPMEPREISIADVTGDGKKDLILLVHNRVLVYPQD